MEKAPLKMKSAWVITQEGTAHSREVIGLLSARTSSRKVKLHLEWLYSFLHCYPETHFRSAKYFNPERACVAEYGTTNLGVPIQECIICGQNPYLEAVLASSIALFPDDEYLQWTRPSRIVQDELTLRIKDRISGVTCRAPMNLPLLKP